jgi:hypothetical protein
MPDSFFGDFLGFTPISWEKIESTEEEPEHFHSTIGIDLKPLQDPPVIEDPKKSSEAK